VARMIHETGPRREGPFVPINCGAIPTELMESEFFGHKKGSFTGAVSDKTGLVQTAEGGTLFLDEVADLPLHMQVKLLRVIQEKTIRPVGQANEVAVDVRILSATHKNLGELVAEGSFREDLFYRINVIPIHLPPLRDREEDIPLLAEYFLAKYRDQMVKDIHGISQETMELLDAYEWPGNIRELENVIERAVALEKSQTILPESLPEHIARRVSKGPAAAGLLPDSGFNLEEHVEGLEKEYITQALVRAGGVQVKAAELLGMSFRSFRYYAKKYNLK
jgi:two-component system response regulator PilR (NtrC family)